MKKIVSLFLVVFLFLSCSLQIPSEVQAEKAVAISNRAKIILTVEVEYSGPYSPEYLAEGEEQLRKDLDLSYPIDTGVTMNVLSKRTQTIVEFNE